ncbi:MAG: hypothetical protein KJZ54_00905 [Phycisphaerales bacterium]|nr:hypothetical protein [Phycisphaerales bacterium]
MTTLPRTQAEPKRTKPLAVAAKGGRGDARVWVGDCRDVLPTLPEVRNREVRLVFADPPFNWNRAYDQWHDAMPDKEYLDFTYQWLDLCVGALATNGSLWVNIPDDWAAEIVVHLKQRGMHMVNWCIWHYRFGQNTSQRFINSKVHALYFSRDPFTRVWRPERVLEVSDRRAIYGDPRTESKRDGMPAGLRVPMDVWYGRYWGRVQGNNKERRAGHDNQLPEVYLERVILACSEKGDLVLDPFTGSGTTGVVACAHGRRFIGVEYSRANAERAVERIRAGMVRKGTASAPTSTAFHPPRQGLKGKRRSADER